jgi:hypothetical protein
VRKGYVEKKSKGGEWSRRFLSLGNVRRAPLLACAAAAQRSLGGAARRRAC